MKNLVIGFLLIALFKGSTLFACCAEKSYRLFPIGEWNKKVVFIEFDLFRNCEEGAGMGEENEFWLYGTVNLVRPEGDSLIRIDNIDSVKIKECVCTYQNQYEESRYENLLGNQYQKGIQIASQLAGFEMGKTREIIFNDTLNTTDKEEITDSTYSRILTYKDLLSIDLFADEVISCFPSKVVETRVYETKNYEVTVIRLRCYLLEDEILARQKELFKDIESAFWKEKAHGHGISKDCYFIRNKDQ